VRSAYAISTFVKYASLESPAAAQLFECVPAYVVAFNRGGGRSVPLAATLRRKLAAVVRMSKYPDPAAVCVISGDMGMSDGYQGG
jgi:hypothetical protein